MKDPSRKHYISFYTVTLRSGHGRCLISNGHTDENTPCICFVIGSVCEVARLREGSHYYSSIVHGDSNQ